MNDKHGAFNQYEYNQPIISIRSKQESQLYLILKRSNFLYLKLYIKNNSYD